MSRRIKSIKGLFGQTIHYSDGIKVGESWPGLFSGIQKHYDANGRYVGYSTPSMIVDSVHHDERGGYIGETRLGFFGQKKHYSVDHGYIGETWDGFAGDATDLVDSDDFASDPDSNDFFDRDEW